MSARDRLNTYCCPAFSVADPIAGVLSGIQRAAQTVLGVYSKRTCSRHTSASSALGALNERYCAIQIHALTHSGESNANTDHQTNANPER